MKGASPELEPQATNRSPNPFSPLLRHFSLPASTVPALLCMCGEATISGANRRGPSNPQSCCKRAMVRGDLCPIHGDLCPLHGDLCPICGDLCPLHPPASGCGFSVPPRAAPAQRQVPQLPALLPSALPLQRAPCARTLCAISMPSACHRLLICFPAT